MTKLVFINPLLSGIGTQDKMKIEKRVLYGKDYIIEFVPGMNCRQNHQYIVIKLKTLFTTYPLAKYF